MKREMCLVKIETTTDYWHRYWHHRVNSLRDAKNFGDFAQSPRLLIEDILAEIKYQGLKNSCNKELFKSELIRWRNSEPAFKSLFDRECGALLSIWGTKPHTMTTICNAIMQKLNDGSYFDALLQELLKALNKDDDFTYSNKGNIHRYSDLLIVELLSKGYDFEDISAAIYLPDVIMAEYEEVLVANDEVCGFKRSDYKSDDDFNNALTKYYAEMTTTQKVELLKVHYNKVAKKAFVLIRLTGIKGEINTYIDDINIYSIGSRKYITDGRDENIETPVKNHILINAAIPVELKCEKSATIQAIDKLKSILALLEVRLETAISFENENITIVLDGKEIYVRNSSLPKFKQDETEIKRICYSEISHYNKDVDNLSQRLATSKNLSVDDFQKISNSAKWIQKATATDLPSDKLLYSWIAIESMSKVSQEYRDEIIPKGDKNILTLIQEIIPPIVVRNKFYNYTQSIFDDLGWNFQMGNRFGLTVETKALLYKKDSDGAVPLSNLFANIDRLSSEIIEESYRTKIEEFKYFYNEDASGISEYKSKAKDEITLIYRLRNMIMHNAIYSAYQVNYYANRALFYASSLYNAILTVSTSNQLSIEDSIIKITSDCRLFESDVKNKLSALYRSNSNS